MAETRRKRGWGPLGFLGGLIAVALLVVLLVFLLGNGSEQQDDVAEDQTSSENQDETAETDESGDPEAGSEAEESAGSGDSGSTSSEGSSSSSGATGESASSGSSTGSGAASSGAGTGSVGEGSASNTGGSASGDGAASTDGESANEGSASADDTDSTAAPPPPTLSVVRIEPDGSSVLAGISVPGASVAIMLDGEEIDVVVADAGDGGFVSYPVIEPSDKLRVLGVEARTEGGTTPMEGEVLIQPSAIPAESQSDGATEAGTGTGTASAASGDDSGSSAPPVSSRTAVIKSGPDGLEILQSGDGARGALTLEVASYTEEGDVQLAGRGPAGASLRIYLDNALSTTRTVGDSGNWSATLANVEPGTYTLRVDALNADGVVVERIEAQFEREDPATLAEAAGTAETSASASGSGSGSSSGSAAPDVPRDVTIVRGDTLWAISRKRYGRGILYVKIFEANRGSIRDPDLIYPGQVFVLPE